MLHSAEELFDVIDTYFLVEAKLKYCRVFTKTGKHQNGEDTGQQLEGWFKGELIYLFSILQQEGQILSWKSEGKMKGIGAKGNNGVPDFMIKIDPSQLPIYLEVKAMYLGWQPDQKVYPSTYFDAGASPQYLGVDVPKLVKLTQSARCFCLAFVYPCPENLKLRKGARWSWQKTRDKFSEKMEKKGIIVKEKKPDKKYSQDLYIARLEITKSDNEG